MSKQLTVGENTFHIGDNVLVHYKILEKEKVAGKAKREVKEEVRERTQIFEGIVISINGEGDGKSFTVRHIAVGKIGVERIFPAISPWIKKVEIKTKGAARRAKLYFLRDKIGREEEVLAEKKEKPKKELKTIKRSAKKKGVNTKK